MRQPTEEEVERAAYELASQERHNPGWCKPGVGNTGKDHGLYRSRAKMILEAALRSPRQGGVPQ